MPVDTEVIVNEELERYDNIVDSAWEDFRDQGLEMPRKPSGMPEWPTNIMELTQNELWRKHSEFAEFLRYVAGLRAQSKSCLDKCKEKTTLVRAAVRKRTKGSNKELREDSTVLDMLYQQTCQEELYWRTLYGLHNSLHEIFDDGVKALSRQIGRLVDNPPTPSNRRFRRG